MPVPFVLTASQMRRIRPCFPLSHGVPRVDDRRIVSGIVFVIKGGLRWRDAPPGYGPHKTLDSRFFRWSRIGVFDRIFAALAGDVNTAAGGAAFGACLSAMLAGAAKGEIGEQFTHPPRRFPRAQARRPTDPGLTPPRR